MKEKIKNKLKQLKSALKTYWWIIPIVVVGIIAMLSLGKGPFGKLYKDLTLRFEGERRRHLSDLTQQDTLRTDERDRQAEIDKTYHETLATIEANHRDTAEAIDADSQARLREIIEETDGDPDAMAAKVNDYFGVPVYKGDGDDK